MATEASTDVVWVRRCRGCGRDDLSAAFGRASTASGRWTCPTCTSRRCEPRRLELPGRDATTRVPRDGEQA